MQHLSDETINETLDQSLTPDQCAEVEAHLAACPECAARLNKMRILFSDLGSLPELDLAVDLAPVIIARLEQNASLPRPIRWLTLVQLTSALIAAILIWPLAEVFVSTLSLSSLSETVAQLTLSWLKVSTDLQIPTLAFEIPPLGLDLTSTTLTLVIVSVSLLWLAGNGLLLIPRSRRSL